MELTGFSDIEGKVTRVGASARGKQTSFKSLLILIRKGDIVLTFLNHPSYFFLPGCVECLIRTADLLPLHNFSFLLFYFRMPIKGEAKLGGRLEKHCLARIRLFGSLQIQTINSVFAS